MDLIELASENRATTPVSGDRVLATALRLLLDPTADRARAGDEIASVAAGQPAAVKGALDSLARTRRRSVCLRDMETVLGTALRVAERQVAPPRPALVSVAPRRSGVRQG